MPGPPLVHEIADVLNAWLNRELKAYIKSVDSKLEKLTTLAEFGGVRSTKPEKTFFRKSRCIGLQNLLKEKAEEEELQEELNGYIGSEASYEDVWNDIAHQSSLASQKWVGASKLGSMASRSSLNASAGSAVTRGTLKSRGTEEIREVILTHQRSSLRCRALTWRFLEDPYSSCWAQAYATLISICTVASVFLTFWQSVKGCPVDEDTGVLLHMVLEAIFGIEILARYIVAPDRIAFWNNIYNYVDLISSMPLPFRLVAIIVSSSDLKELPGKIAFLPVLRLLKLMRKFESFQLLFSAFLLALEVLPVLLYTMSIIAFFFAALIRMCEPADNIESLPHALWFILVTMTTVGYGDVSPVTTQGRMVVSLLMVISMLYMAIPIGIVGNAFSQVWDARDRLLLMRRLRDAFLRQGFSAKALRSIIAQFDVDGDGVFSLEEFQSMLRAMRINISDERVMMLMASLDEDGSGSINLEELMSGLFPRDFSELLNSMALRTRASTDLASRATVLLSPNGNGSSPKESLKWSPKGSKASDPRSLTPVQTASADSKLRPPVNGHKY